jgi:replicative DNA helicase
MKELLEKDEKTDVITTMAIIKNKERYNINSYWATGLVEGVPTSANIESYAKIIYQKYRTREIIKEARKVQRNANDDSMKYKDILELVRSLSDQFLDGEQFNEFDIAQCAKETIESIRNNDSLVKFGFNQLDGMAGGMTPGEITVIAGRPGHGKTTFAMNLIKNLLEQDKKVMVINREMTNTEMMKKLIVNLSNHISYRSIRCGNITDKDGKEVNAVLQFITTEYKDKLIMYDDVYDMPETISAISRHRPDVIIDDYIQLVRVQDMDARRFEIEYVMQEYKWIAKKYKAIPILVSQLNRDIERRIDSIPKMSDLAEGSSIEQIAENVIFVYYDYKINYENSEIGRDFSQLVAAKVRYGVSGTFKVGFDGDKARFYETDTPATPNKHIEQKASESLFE